MTAPNMATITAALERSLQNCSLSTSPSANSHRILQDHQPNDETRSSSLELNSHLSLPYEWEQCLDLKSGEIYYINWRNGMKVKEDPREVEPFKGEYSYSEEDNSSGESDGSSSSPSSPPPTEDYQRCCDKDHVLVVAGCKSCFMYLMLPKTVTECPKCKGTILHFDREENEYL